MTILFLGDIVGRIGRRAVAELLPKLKHEYKPDLVIANGENLAHGKGVTEATVAEMTEAGVDLLTSGNHILRKQAYKELVEQQDYKVIRPANYPPDVPGHGYKVLDVGGIKVAVINLMGRILFKETLDDPFRKLEEIIAELAKENSKMISIIDWHTEATSEKAALAWYFDGRVTAVIGTHTHVPTADARILPGGTAFISDVGMVGARDSMLGVVKEGPIETMRTQIPQHFEIPESGVVRLNGIFLEVDAQTSMVTKFERFDRDVEVDE